MSLCFRILGPRRPEFPSGDAGGGWLIFALPPTELSLHPTNESEQHELYLMCDDMERTVEQLEKKGVEFTKPISDEGFGLVTRMKHLSPVVPTAGGA